MPRETYEQELRGSRAARGCLGSRQRMSTAPSVVESAYEAVVTAGDAEEEFRKPSRVATGVLRQERPSCPRRKARARL